MRVVLLLLAVALAGSKTVKTMEIKMPTQLKEDYLYYGQKGGTYLLETNSITGFHERRTGIRYENFVPIPGKNLFIAQKNGLWGIVSIQGEVMVPFLFDQIRYDGKAAEGVLVVSWLGKEGCLKLSDFSELVPIAYDSISTFIDGKAIVQKDGKYGIIDQDGHFDIPVDYDQVHIREDGTLALYDEF